MSSVGTRASELLGRPIDGVWSAPGRVNLIGEHVDYNDGVVLPLAILQRTAVAAAARADGRLVLRSLQRSESLEHPVGVDVDALRPGAVEGWAGYAAGVVWALRELAGPEVLAGGADLVVDGRVPAGAGLSSSAALECAVALAVDSLAGLGLEPSALARAAQHAENDFVGVPCGLMDQMASMVCTEGHALELDLRSGDARQVPLDLSASGALLLVIDTRAHHALADGAYADRRSACERAAAQLGLPSLREASADDVARLDDPLLRRRAGHVVDEIARVIAAVDALEAGDLATLGELMSASHASLRDDYEVSCAELDVAVDAALAVGAYGARMTGGGFGGSAIALVREADAGGVEAEVRERFAREGFAEPDVRPVTPGPGARRDA